MEQGALPVSAKYAGLRDLNQIVLTPLSASDALAKQFEAKARDAATVIESLSDAEWKKVTAAEQWTVAATAHHLARAFEAVSGIVTGLVSGKLPGGFTRGMLDGMNAQHAKEFADMGVPGMRQVEQHYTPGMSHDQRVGPAAVRTAPSQARSAPSSEWEKRTKQFDDTQEISNGF